MNDVFKFLEAELQWLEKVVHVKQILNAADQSQYTSVYEVTPPHAGKSSSPYAKWIHELKLTFEERLLMIIAIAAHLKPALFDIFLTKNPIPIAFGGVIASNNRRFLPTSETFFFLLAGDSIPKRMELQLLFHNDHPFKKANLLWLEKHEQCFGAYSGVIAIADDYLELFTLGSAQKPDFSSDFPAKLITTELEWDDMILVKKTRLELNEIELWIQHHKLFMEDPAYRKRNKMGYHALFSGPSGTGKTLAASLIGKKTGRDVYRIDLSAIVSKYIGETEKNLARLFDKAEGKNWILFFDEADALFGKRTSVSDSHDRYANQEVSFLLQRIEYFQGLVILATNMKNNIDKAFLRRFHNIVEFSKPDAAERLILWENTVPKRLKFDKEEVSKLISKYDLTGANISNIMAYCLLMTADQGNGDVSNSLLIKAISRELNKEGRTV